MWPIRRRHSCTSSFLLVLEDDDQGARRGFIAFSLEEPAVSQSFCQLDWIWDEHKARKSPAGRGKNRERCASEARFAASSARSFPTMPIWLGIQQNSTHLPTRSSDVRRTKMSCSIGLYVLKSLSDKRLLSESVKITYERSSHTSMKHNAL